MKALVVRVLSENVDTSRGLCPEATFDGGKTGVSLTEFRL